MCGERCRSNRQRGGRAGSPGSACWHAAPVTGRPCSVQPLSGPGQMGSPGPQVSTHCPLVPGREHGALTRQDIPRAARVLRSPSPWGHGVWTPTAPRVHPLVHASLRPPLRVASPSSSRDRATPRVGVSVWAMARVRWPCRVPGGTSKVRGGVRAPGMGAPGVMCSQGLGEGQWLSSAGPGGVSVGLGGCRAGSPSPGVGHTHTRRHMAQS